MKHLTLIIVFSILCTWTLYAQQDFWEQMNGPPGIGCTPHFAAGINPKGHIFAGSLEGFIYRSTDDGMNWKTFNIEAEVHCLAVSQTGYIFAGGWGNGVYRSTDDGETWEITNCQDAVCVSMIADSAGGIVVGTWSPGGLLRSTDDGETWTQIGPCNCQITGLSVNRSGHIFVMGDNVLYRSTDNGSTWFNTGLNYGAYGIAFASNNDVYVLGAYERGLWVSTNNGASWDTIHSLPPLPSGACFNGLRIDSDDNIFFCGLRSYGDKIPGTYRSTDLGSTWTKIWDLDSWDFLFDQLGHTIMFTEGAGIFHSTDKGDHWQLSGSPTGHIWSMAISQSGGLVVGSRFIRDSLGGGVHFSDDRGNSWSFAGLHGLEIPCLSTGNLGSFWAGTNNGIYSTTDLGVNWTPSGLPNTSVLCMERSTSGNIFAGTGGSGLYRSTDDGVSWLYVGLMNTAIRSIFNYGADIIFVGVENGGVYRSTDDGTSWAFVGLPGTTVTALTRGSMNGLLAATSSGAYGSTDGGTSWSFAGLNGRDVRDLISSSSGDIYAATGDSGVYLSLNNGQNWAAVNSGLNHLNVTSLVIDHDGYLYAGTDGGGVYKSTIVAGGKVEIITATASAHGRINPSGNIAVLYGEAQRFIFIPDDALCSVDTVYVDDVVVDSTEGYTFHNVTTPHTLHVVFKANPGIQYMARSGWNLVSVPVNVTDRCRTTLFPYATTEAYMYDTCYHACDTLDCGAGHWIKFPSENMVAFSGSPIDFDTIDLKVGWNLIGSIGVPVSVLNIQTNTGGIIVSQFFGYDGSYHHTDTIHPGRGYWVKANQAGQLILSKSVSRLATNRIRIQETEEYPPRPPNEAAEPSSTQLIPTMYALAQNYPNPFNPVTVFAYGLPERSVVRLELFNALGQTVARLADGEQEAGYHTIEWTIPAGMSSGPYFYRLTAASLANPANVFVTALKLTVAK